MDSTEDDQEQAGTSQMDEDNDEGQFVIPGMILFSEETVWVPLPPQSAWEIYYLEIFADINKDNVPPDPLDPNAEIDDLEIDPGPDIIEETPFRRPAVPLNSKALKVIDDICMRYTGKTIEGLVNQTKKERMASHAAKEAARRHLILPKFASTGQSKQI